MERLPPELLRIILEYCIAFCKLPSPNLLKSVYPLSQISRKWKRICGAILEDQSWNSQVSIILSNSSSISGEAMLNLLRKQKIHLEKVVSLNLYPIHFGTPPTVFQTLSSLQRIFISQPSFIAGKANISPLPKLSIAFPRITSLGIVRAGYGVRDLDFPDGLQNLELLDNHYASSIFLPTNLVTLHYRCATDYIPSMPTSLTSLSYLVPNSHQMDFSLLKHLKRLELYFSAEMIRSVRSCCADQQANLEILSLRSVHVDFRPTEINAAFYHQTEAIQELLSLAPALETLRTLVLPSDLLSESELDLFPMLTTVFLDPIEEDDAIRSKVLRYSSSRRRGGGTRRSVSGLPIGLRTVPSALSASSIRKLNNVARDANENDTSVLEQWKYAFQFLIIVIIFSLAYFLAVSESFSDYLHSR